jgi:hypothetical protein
MAVEAGTIAIDDPPVPVPVARDLADEGATSEHRARPPKAEPPVRSARDQAARRRRWAFRGLTALILLGAALVRLWPIGASLPYPGYVDEAHTVHHGADMVVERTVDPEWYDYPTLPIAVSGVILEIADLPATHAKRAQDLQFTAEGGVYDDIRPTRGLIGTRLFTTFLSVGTVLLVMIATAKLTRRRVALVAGVIAAVTPALVQRGLFDLVDTMATFFVCAAFVAGLAVVHARRRSRRFAWTLVAGACCGLAASSKYPSGAALLMVLVLVGIACSGSVGKRVVRSVIATVATGVVFVATMPAVLTNRDEVIAGVTKNYDRYATKTFAEKYWSSSLHTTEIGVALLVAAAVGIVLLLRHRGTRLPTVAWLSYAVVLTAVAARLPFQPFRNLLSIIPFVCVAAAVGIDAVVRGITTWVAGDRRRIADVAVAAVLAVLVVHLSLGGIRPFLNNAMKPDTRVEAREWLQTHVQPGDSVVVLAELAMAKSELDKIPGSVTVISSVDGSVLRGENQPPAPGGASYVVTATIKGTDFPWVPKLGLREVASFGFRDIPAELNLNRGNDAAVVILHTPS